MGLAFEVDIRIPLPASPFTIGSLLPFRVDDA